MQRIGQFAAAIGAALAQFLCYFFGNVTNPTLREIKANDAYRIAVLALQQILDDRFKTGVFDVCLSPSTSHCTEVIEDEINVLVHDGDNRW